MNWSQFFLNPALIWILIPLAYILITGIKSLVNAYYLHVERMAMIEKGLDPTEHHDPEED